jgi:hypothetical protein
MGTLKTTNIESISGSGTVTLGTSGETFNVPSGVTISNSGTATGFGGANSDLFFVYKSASDGDQSISGTTQTKVTLATEDYDTGSNFASDKYTAPSDGKYFFSAQVEDDFTSGQRRDLSLYKNGSAFITTRQYSYGTTRHGTRVVAVLDLSATDYIEVYIYQGDSGARNINGIDTRNTSFFGYKINT